MILHLRTFAVLSGILSSASAGTGLALDLRPQAWRTHVLNLESVPEREAVTFGISAAGLAVGPWLAGAQGARFEYVEPVPVTSGMILGSYRTDGLNTRQAQVWLQFLARDKVLSTCDYPLAASSEWRDLALPVYRAPPGTTGIGVAFGLREKTSGRVLFRNLHISDRYEPLPFEDPPRLTRAAPPPNGAAGARVRLENKGGTWWLIAPSGRPFFASGSAMSESDTEGVMPSGRVAAEIGELGFNSVGGDHAVAQWSTFNSEREAAGQPVIYQFRIAESNAPGEYDLVEDAHGGNPGPRTAEAVKIGGFNHAFPDPFDPRWAEAFRAEVRRLAQTTRGKGYLAAWFAGNERHHRDLPRFVWSRHCAVALGAFLEAKYATIAALNRRWGSSYVSFADLLKQKPDPVICRGPMYEDFRLFSRVLVGKYNEIMLRTIRSEDPGGLVFSNRFMMGEVGDVMDLLDLYRGFDAIAVNLYPSSTEAGPDASERQYLDEVHRRTGKPIFISEWSVPALDSGLYQDPGKLDWSYPQTVVNQHDRARQAAQTAAYFYNLPFVIGAQWFTWSDIDSPRRKANRGLFRADGQPWTELIDALGAVNRQFPRL